MIEEEIKARYLVHQFLGKGSYAVVHEAVEKKKGTRVALKIMDKQKLGDSGMESVRNEISVMQEMSHPLLLRLHDTFQTDRSVVLELELVEGGELFKRILELKHYSERTACRLMLHVCQAVEYMHSNGIVHRDLKPENILLLDKDTEECTNIKIADFGFATRYKGQVMTKACGTPYYIAPELLHCGVFKTRASYNHQCDMWSLGCIAYVLLCGYPPFRAEDKGRLFRCIVAGKLKFDNPAWDKISPGAKSFITKCLVQDPAKRLTAKESLKDPWFLDGGAMASDDHLTDSLEGIKELSAKGKFRAAVFGVEAAFRIMYLGMCLKSGVRENTAVLDTLAAATEPLTMIDMTNNYLGERGLTLLLQLLLEHKCVHTLILRNSLIETEQAAAIAQALRHSIAPITSVDFSQNPLSHAAARAMLTTMQLRRRIVECNLDGTGVSDNLKRRVDAQATLNRVYIKWMASNLPPVPPPTDTPKTEVAPRPKTTTIPAMALPPIPQPNKPSTAKPSLQIKPKQPVKGM